MIVKSKRWSQDETGQWWYTFGKKYKTRTRGIVRKCALCKEEYPTTEYRLKQGGKKGQYCSSSCGAKALGGHPNKSGEKSHFWKGGRNTIRGGYVEVFAPDHPYARGKKYVREHRLVMEKMLGRYLEPYEQVHHKNGIKHDNRPENLELISLRVHLGNVECPFCHKNFAIK